MIAATVTLTTAGQSLRTLIDAATSPSQIPATFNNRVAEIQIQWASGAAFHLVYKAGTVNLATDSGFLFDTTNRLLTLRAPTWNQLSLGDTYLAGEAGAETARITTYSI